MVPNKTRRFLMRVFLTGGTGFIGHYVAKNLLECGHTVNILTRHPDKIPSLKKHPGVTLVCGSIHDVVAMRQGLEGCDACIHIALGWGETPLAMLENDTRATALLLELASINGCKKFIYTSSTAAMGKMRPSMTENTVLMPIDLYGATKAAGEAYVLGFTSTSMRRNIVRPGYTFGNPAWPDGCSQPDKRFTEMARAILTDQDIHIIKNDGTQFIHASQQAKLFASVLDSNFNEEVFLSLGSSWIGWKEIAEHMITKHPQSKSKIIEKDLGWAEKPMLYSVAKIATSFGLALDGREFLDDHIQWQMNQIK